MSTNAVSRLALVTGASSGIGMQLARLFAADRIDLVLVARRAQELESLAADLRNESGVAVTVLPLDLAQPGAARALFAALQSRSLVVTDLCNNAGFGLFGLFQDTALDDEAAMIQLNITALTELTELCLPPMVASHDGRILNVASTASFQPGPYMAVYYASKAYVLSFSEALATELKGSGVTVTALCPGPTRTGFQTRAAMHHSALLKNVALTAVDDVARSGYRAMQHGKRVVIPGWINRIGVFSTPLLPRWMSAAIVKKISAPQ